MSTTTVTEHQFQIFAFGVPVSPVYPDRGFAESMLRNRDFGPGEAEVREVAIVITKQETSLHYINAYGETCRLPMDPSLAEAQTQYAWRKQMEVEGKYKDVRWETRTVTTTTSPWETVETEENDR